jgi:DNA-binding NtrC family response regulator
LILSELFGHEAGAFTGAVNRYVGAFERAAGGTLFLDEVGELGPQLQPSLLGALERRRFRRVGGTNPISVDVRVVAATHRDLREAVNKGTFREDLFFRLGVVTLTLPPLRERPSDILLLAEHFIRQAGHDKTLHELVEPEVMDTLMAYRWPGNVRELRNFVEATLALGEPPQLTARESTEAGGAGWSTLDPAMLLESPYKDARRLVLDEFEELYCRHHLTKADGNATRAARNAEMNRSYLLELLKRRGIR